MNPKVEALCQELSKVRRALTDAGAEQARLEAVTRQLSARCEELGRQLAHRDAEILRMRQDWIPRRVHEACLRIDGATVREYSR